MRPAHAAHDVVAATKAMLALCDRVADSGDGSRVMEEAADILARHTCIAPAMVLAPNPTPQVLAASRTPTADQQEALAAVGSGMDDGTVEMVTHEGHPLLVARLTLPEVVLLGGPAPGCGPIDTDILCLVARTARTAVTLARQRGEERSARTQAEMLTTIGIRLAAQGSLDALLSHLVDDARELLDADYAALGVVADGGGRLERFLTSGLTTAQVEKVGAPPQGRGMLGVLLEHASPIRVANIGDDPRHCGFPPGHPPMTTFLGVPITHRGVVMGNLYVTDKRGGGPFTNDDERIAMTLAAQAAVAVANARRYENETYLRRELQSVHEVAEAVLGTLDLSQLLPMIAERAQSLCGGDIVAIGLGRDDITFRAAHGVGSEVLVGFTVPGSAESCHQHLGALFTDARVICERLAVDGERIGALVAVSHAPFGPYAHHTLTLFAKHAAIAVANGEQFAAERARLRESARIQAAEARSAVLAEAVQRAIDAQERERARVARELHDEAGQSLTALALALRMLDDNVDDAGREKLAALRQMVNGVSADLRDLATDLRPSGLREHGLASAIERHAARVRETSQITVDTVVAGDVGDLPDHVQVALLRVVQEALTNVVRHADARRASVLVSRSGAGVRAVVEDDGRGFDPTAPTDRLGVKGMRERVEILGGELRIESGPGEGTVVIVDVEGIGS